MVNPTNTQRIEDLEAEIIRIPTQINSALDRIRSEISQNNQQNENLSAQITMINQTLQMICEKMNPEKITQTEHLIENPPPFTQPKPNSVNNNLTLNNLESPERGSWRS